MKKPLIKVTILVAFLFGSNVFAASPLVDVGWIKQHSCDENVRVLDIRNPLDGATRTDYLKGHIPCAVYTNYLTGGWRTMVNKVPGQLPSTDKIAKLIGNLGIDNNTHVVIYHHGKSALDLGSATRVYWTLKVLGHDNTSILNGGYLAYISDKKNKPQKGNNKVSAKTFKAQLRSDMMASAEDVKMAIDDSSVQLIDLRPRHQYIGINRHPKAKRNGTIPSAKNLPESWMTVNGGGTIRNNNDLAKLYDIAGIDSSGKQINFCNTGHWASLGWFVSSELMGNDSARLYDGSMVEWTANNSLPMVRDINF